MYWIKVVGWYTLAGLVFPYSWLLEQRSVIYMAWLDSFGEANEQVRRLSEKERNRW